MGKRQVQREALDATNIPTPTTPLQRYGRVTGIRGGGLYDILITETSNPPAANEQGATATTTPTAMVLIQLPNKFRKVIWVKLGSFVLIELLAEVTTKVHGDILSVLRPEHLKVLKTEGKWPVVLDPPAAAVESEEDEDDEVINNSESDDNDDDLFVNRNRMHVEYESDSEDGE
ncbi:hypothetical protein BDR26DRAFT_1008012 [Obelidium mucronatum]|nr:hypothetical protein BDR26DRAFT_1008012 [Obelidium mucronatum]